MAEAPKFHFLKGNRPVNLAHVEALKQSMKDKPLTVDYNLFKVLKGNRPVNLAHVEALKQSMKDKPLPE